MVRRSCGGLVLRLALVLAYPLTTYAAAPSPDDFLRDARSSMKTEAEYVKFVLNLIQNSNAKAPLRLAALKVARRLQAEPPETDGTGRMPVLQARADEIGGVVRRLFAQQNTPAELVPAALEIVIHDLRADLGSLGEVARSIRSIGGDSSYTGQRLSAAKAKVAEQALGPCAMHGALATTLPRPLHSAAWLDSKPPHDGRCTESISTTPRPAVWLSAASIRTVCIGPKQPAWCNPKAWAGSPPQNAADNWSQTRTMLDNIDPAEIDF